MNILDFEKLVKSEKSARRHVLTRCGMVGSFRCPRCSFERLYEIEDGKRRRCARCGHSFNPFAGRYLDNVKLSSLEWLWIIKLFEIETPATVIADETGLSYPTVFKALDTIRFAIADMQRDGRDTRENRAAAEGCAIFGISKKNGAPKKNGLMKSDVASRGIERLDGDFVFLCVLVGNNYLVLTESMADYACITFCDRRLDIVDHGTHYPKYRAYSDAKGFWPFAKERLARRHGVSPKKLPLYLEEMSFRWTNRGTALFDLILAQLCRYAPGKGIHLEPDAEESRIETVADHCLQ